MLSANSHIFIRGIAGIGKSELAKAYAWSHKNRYTNIIYIHYSGNLYDDIAELDFADDRYDEDTATRFKHHNRFLRALNPDTLLIIDNFNATAAKDTLLPVVLKYRCKILFTTRNRINGQQELELKEIADRNELKNLVRFFYHGEAAEEVIDDIIDTVHKHTMAVEMAARLMETGLLSPEELLERLKIENVALQNNDRVNIQKDSTICNDTYYGHLHTLFSLFTLSNSMKLALRSMTFIPEAGIDRRYFARLLGFSDMNTLNALSEMGLIQPLPGGKIALHPIIKEISIADLKPSVSNCQPLIESLDISCLSFGLEQPYHSMMFEIITNIIGGADNDDLNLYLRLIEDAYESMHKYDDRSGMELIMNELDEIIRKQGKGCEKDRLLLSEMKAIATKDYGEGTKMYEKIVANLPAPDPETAAIISNIRSNLGLRYLEAHDLEKAETEFEEALRITNTFKLANNYNALAQSYNYAAVLSESGKIEQAIKILEGLSDFLKKSVMKYSIDSYRVEQMLNLQYLRTGKAPEAITHSKSAEEIAGVLDLTVADWRSYV